jgi:hypothetical protein
MNMDYNDCTHVFAVPGSRICIDFVHPNTGASIINGESLDQIRERYPDAVIVSYDEWSATRAAEQDTPIDWTDTTAERYDEMLGCVPPAFWRAGLFLVGEPMDHHALSGAPRFSAFRQIGSRYFESSRPITIREAKSILSAQYASA